MSRARLNGGFTLIEVLVAITLASLVAVIGAAVLRAALDFHSRANRHLKASEDLRAADRLLAHEWSQRREPDLVATANRLEFQTDRLYGVGAEGAARVRYLCAGNDAGQMVFERRLLARAAAGWRVLRIDVLVPQLLECDFAYLQTSESRGAKIAQWRAEAGTGQPVPRLVRLRLVTQRGDIAPLVYGIQGAGG